MERAGVKVFTRVYISRLGLRQAQGHGHREQHCSSHKVSFSFRWGLHRPAAVQSGR